MAYRSRTTLLGLPLADIAVGTLNGVPAPRVARGWIAVGDIAFGVVAIGGISVGVVTMGGITVGVLAFGGAALAAASIGGLAVGVLACGGAAFGWHAALGGLAVARHFAEGGAAYAAHANDFAAELYFDTSPFFRAVEFSMRHRWLAAIFVVPVLIARAIGRMLASR